MTRKHILSLSIICLFLICLGVQVRPALAATFTVNSTADDGTPGTLRWAIEQANITAGANTINFNIGGAGVHTITVTSDFPIITNSVIINGMTQSGASCGTSPGTAALLIEVRGSGLFSGLVISTTNTTLRGLIINGFSDAGVIINGNNNTITCDFIGTNAAGSAALANDGDGVRISGGSNTIGGTTAGTGNLISGNGGSGIQITSANGKNNSITGNYIGTNAAGTARIANVTSGVYITAGATTNTVGGLTTAARNLISGNTGIGVQISGVGTLGNTVQGNYIGTTLSGNAALGNGAVGISVDTGASPNTIGGTTAGAGNLISGNVASGVSIDAANNITVAGNLIGTNAAGTARIANGGSGVSITTAATGNTIGGTTAAARNLIAGNTANGVLIDGVNTNANSVIGNYIGTNGAGTGALTNGANGVRIDDSAANNIIGGSTPGSGNLISGNTLAGVLITDADTNGNTVAGNLIGTNAAGTGPLPNAQSGVKIISAAASNTIGGTTAGARNVISGNTSNGVTLAGSSTTDNVISGNYIGTTSSGTGKLPNGGDGVNISINATNNTVGGTTAGARNVISGNALNGVSVLGTATNAIQGNYIGTTASGTVALGNTGSGVAVRTGAVNIQVGGTVAGAGNLISGNNYGVIVSDSGTTSTLIADNTIGTDFNGDNPIPNANAGILISSGATNTTVGGPTAVGRNLISGNSPYGILIIGSAGNVVSDNYIGTNGSGTAAVPNGVGIWIQSGAVNNTIGGTLTGAGNLIAFNQSAGVVVVGTGSTGNLLLGNSITNNGGLGIDLGNDGITANDANDSDSGPNNLQNYPFISVGADAGGAVTVGGTLNSAPNGTFRIEFFDSPTCHVSTYGQGARFIGALSVTTNAAGVATFNKSLGAVSLGHVITATATDSANNTSEFSRCAPVVTRKPDTVGIYWGGTFYLRNSNAAGNPDITVQFGVAGNLPVAGDWNGDGIDTIGVYISELGVFLLRDSNTPGAADHAFVMGNPGDEPIAGKWDASMTHDGVGVYRPSNGLLFGKRTLVNGFADYTMVLGNPGDHGIAGDWDGNGFDSIGVYRPSGTRYYLANQMGGTTTTPAIIFSDYDFAFGPPNLTPIAGDWTGTGITRVGYLINGLFFLKNDFTNGGAADTSFPYGGPGALPVTGKWTGTGSVAPIAGVIVNPITTRTPGTDGRFD